jgi:hypothetical protein
LNLHLSQGAPMDEVFLISRILFAYLVIGSVT